MKKKNMHQPGKFKMFLGIYSGILTGIIIITLVLLHGLLKDYEEGRPASAMDKIISEFSADQIDGLVSATAVDYSEFETSDTVTGYLKEKIGSETVSYKKKSGEYSEETPVYVVYAGDTPIAKVDLAADGKNRHKFTKWKLGSVSFSCYVDTQEQMQVSVPKGSTLKLNGVTVGSEYITQDDVEFVPCKNVGDYVTKPVRTVYTITGLLAQPEITVEYDGQELELEVSKNVYTAQYPENDQLLASEKSRIQEIGEAYGKYIINRGSLETLNKYMIGKAKEYVSDVPAIWAFLYGKTYTYEFQNESIDHLVKYSDNCFSVDIEYDLYVDWSTGNKTYDTSLTYTFVKRNGTWYVADFSIN